MEKNTHRKLLIFSSLIFFWVSTIRGEMKPPGEFYVIDTIWLKDLSVDQKSQLDSILTVYHIQGIDTAKFHILSKLLHYVPPKVALQYAIAQTDLLQTIKGSGSFKGKKATYYHYNYVNLNNLAHHYIVTAQLDSADIILNRSLEIQKAFPDSSVLGRTYGLLGCVYRDRDAWKEAINYFEKSVAVNRRIGKLAHLSYELNELGEIYINKRMYARAIECLYESLALIEKNETNHQTVFTLNRLSLVYFKNNDLDKALEMANKSISYTGSVPAMHSRTIAEAFLCKGRVLHAMEEYRLSLKEYHKGLPILGELNHYPYLVFLYTSIGENYEYLGILDSAEIAYDKAYHLSDSLVYGYHAFHILYAKSRTSFKKGEIELAIQLAEKALSISEEPHYLPENISKITLLLSQIYEHKKEKEKALYYYKLYSEAKDSLNVKENQAAISNFEFLKERELFSKELEINEKEKLLLEKKNQQKIMLLVGIVILSLLLLVIAFVIRKGYVKEQIIAANKLKLLNLEKEKLTESIHHKTELLEASLNQIKQKNDTLNEIKKRKIISKKDFSNLLKTGVNWTEFIKHFESLYSGFIKKLSEAYPALTPSDLKFCILFRINCSIKEMAEIMNISIDGAKKGRARAKGKLGVANGKSVHTFLTELDTNGPKA